MNIKELKKAQDEAKANPPENLKDCWKNYNWFCPKCGSRLTYKENDEFLCTNNECVFSSIVGLTVFHPIYGVGHDPGDSWAIGYIK